MQTPNITTAQLLAVLGSVLGLLAAFGLPVNHHESDAIVQLVTVLAPVLLAADAIIRHGRATASGARHAGPGPVPDAIPSIAPPAAQVPADGSGSAAV